MKIPAWIKALAFLRFVIRYDGKHFGTIEKKFWSYEKALEFKNAVLGVSKNLSFEGYHVLRGRTGFYYKYSGINPWISWWTPMIANPDIIINDTGWTAEAVE